MCLSSPPSWQNKRAPWWYTSYVKSLGGYDHSSFVPILVLGVLVVGLIGFSLFATLVPIKDCPDCDIEPLKQWFDKRQVTLLS